MNYIAEMKAFYDLLETNPLPTSSIALWHALMHICNKTGWQLKFAVAVSVLEIKTGLKRQAIYDARNKLKQAGLISFEGRAGNQSSIYWLNPLVSVKQTQEHTQSIETEFVSVKQTQLPTQEHTQCHTQEHTQPDTQSPTINKLNDTKQKEMEIVSDIQKESEWVDFVAMRKKIKKPLTDRAVKMAISKLEELASGDIETQKQILNQSTFHCWQGLFPLKSSSNVSPEYDDQSSADDTMQQLYGGRRTG